VLVILFLLYSTNAFYLPGLAPVNYCTKSKETEGCKSAIAVFVNRLNSEEAIIPFEYEHFDFCQSSEDASPVENLGQVVFGERIRSSPYKVIPSTTKI